MQMDVTGPSMYTLTLQIYFIFLITNVQELILLLQSRRLIVANPVKAERYLELFILLSIGLHVPTILTTFAW